MGTKQNIELYTEYAHNYAETEHEKKEHEKNTLAQKRNMRKIH